MTELFAATAPVFKVDGERRSRPRPRRQLSAHRGSDRRPEDARAASCVAEGPRAERGGGRPALSRRTDDRLRQGARGVDRAGRRRAHRLHRRGQRDRGELHERRRAVGDGIRRRQADDAAHDAPHEDVRERERCRHRAGDRAGARHCTAERERRRSDLQGRAAVEPERPRVPARARAADPGRGLVRRRHACTSRRAAIARRRRSRSCYGQRSARGAAARRSCASAHDR